MERAKCTPEIIRFLRKNTKGKTNAELCELVNTRFGTAFTKKQIISAKKNRGIKGGCMGRPRLPLFSEAIDSRGFLIVKSSDKGKPSYWKRKHTLLWEKANGKIPKGMKLIFLDGDKTHCELDNLALVTDGEFLKMIQFNLLSNEKELTKTGIAIVQHNVAFHKKLEQLLGRKGYASFMSLRGYYKRKKAAAT
jgi:hypothetical protein